MASTLTLMLLEGTEARVCNLGDSRTFLVRRGELRRLTRDHTVLTEMQEAGIDTTTAFAKRHRNSLTGAVGMEDRVEPECTG
jgi:serine/threonine protein phosphatase PrpC